MAQVDKSCPVVPPKDREQPTTADSRTLRTATSVAS